MVKVSVIVSVYNDEECLEKCLNSLVNQTLSDIEIICINNESVDNLNVLESYVDNDNRITLENSKDGILRDNTIDIAKGEYISFVDMDDCLELDALEKLYNNTINNQSNITLFNSKDKIFNEINKKDKIIQDLNQKLEEEKLISSKTKEYLFVLELKYNNVLRNKNKIAKQNKKLKSSNSWKITKPLRYIRNKFR